MNRAIRLAIALGALCLVAIASFLVGGTVGFQYGRWFQAGQTSATDAATLPTDLQNLRDGELDTALSSLESKLDGHFLSHGLSLLEANQLSDLWRLNAGYGDKLVRVAAVYRSKHPHEADDPQVDETLSGIVSCLLQTSPDLPDTEFRAALRSCYRQAW